MLLFDIGNSRCKWARVESGNWQQQGVLSNSDNSAWQLLKENFARHTAPKKILVSNVAGTELQKKIIGVCSIWPISVEFLTVQTEQCGVHNSYERAERLGSDRWAALIAAWHRTRGACLVVNCGTAITVDTLSARGEFLGGLILPGLELMQCSLLQHTALLGMEKGAVCNYPRNTADAIFSGVARAAAGAIQYQYNLSADQGRVKCLISGGAAKLLLPNLNIAVELLDNLVLLGLEIIGKDA